MEARQATDRQIEAVRARLRAKIQSMTAAGKSAIAIAALESKLLSMPLSQSTAAASIDGGRILNQSTELELLLASFKNDSMDVSQPVSGSPQDNLESLPAPTSSPPRVHPAARSRDLTDPVFVSSLNISPGATRRLARAPAKVGDDQSRDMMDVAKSLKFANE
jgi:hypothetical protein